MSPLDEMIDVYLFLERVNTGPCFVLLRISRTHK